MINLPTFFQFILDYWAWLNFKIVSKKACSAFKKNRNLCHACLFFLKNSANFEKWIIPNYFFYSDAGEAPLDIFLVDDLGQFEPKVKKVSEKVFDCAYTPRAKQHKQTVFVNFGGVAVPGSPFRVVNDNLNDPSLVCS